LRGGGKISTKTVSQGGWQPPWQFQQGTAEIHVQRSDDQPAASRTHVCPSRRVFEHIGMVRTPISSHTELTLANNIYVATGFMHTAWTKIVWWEHRRGKSEKNTAREEKESLMQMCFSQNFIE